MKTTFLLSILLLVISALEIYLTMPSLWLDMLLYPVLLLLAFNSGKMIWIQIQKLKEDQAYVQQVTAELHRLQY